MVIGMCRVAVIILNYNTWKATLGEVKLIIDKIINSKSGKKPVIGTEDIIVVDNRSANNSYEKLLKYSGKKYTLLASDRNGGYAYGNNIGLKYAYDKGYDYAWILNNDILFDDEALLEKLLWVFSKDDGLAVVNPQIYGPGGHLFNYDAERPMFFDFTLGINSYRKKGRQIKDLGGYAYVYRPQGCCMMVDLKKLNDVAYMDEHTFLYSEELILAERLLAKGYRCACCIGARIIHDHSSTVGSIIGKGKTLKIKRESFDYYLKNYRHFSWLKRKICCIFYDVKNLALDIQELKSSKAKESKG